ncbi:MAG: radical SAM protein [Bdellovibrionales bacterium]|nr:radical SAM protein [Bdellovibrionales bacterium]
MLKINEIFFSLQGESSKSGLPTTFIRLSGCHLRCQYCDTKYAYHNGENLDIKSIIKKVKNYQSKHVCITGGEPLLQKSVYPLMTQLCDKGYKVSLETSGDKSAVLVDNRVKKIIDIKTPDSKAGVSVHFDNLKNLSNTELKFVICSDKDFNWAENFVKENNLSESKILYSPSFGEVTATHLAEKILSSGSSAQLQIQLHKYLWPNKESGI